MRQQGTDVVAILLRIERAIRVEVVAQRHVDRGAVVRTNPVSEIEAATAEAARLDLEVVIADIRGGTRAGALDVELSPGSERRGVAEIRVAFPRGPDDARIEAAVAAARIEPVARRRAAILVVIAVNREIGAAIVEIEAVSATEAVGVTADVIGETVVGGKEPAVQPTLQDGVDHTRDSVGPVDRRCAIAQHLDPPNAARADRIGVGRDDGYEQLGLEPWVVDHAAPVDQEQRVSRPERAQVNRGDIATHAVDPARRVLFVECYETGLRDGSEKFVTIAGIDGFDLLLVDAGYRQDIVDPGAADLRAGNDDQVVIFARIRFRARRIVVVVAFVLLLRRERAGQNERQRKRGSPKKRRASKAHHISPQDSISASLGKT